MILVKQSTARTVIVGPVLDSSGAAVTSAVVGDFKISKNGGAPATLNASATLTHRNTGHYSLALTASDTDTIGQAEIVIDATTNACPVKEIGVLHANVYDVLFGSTALSTYAGADTSGTTTLLSRIGSALTITSGRVNADITHILGTAPTESASGRVAAAFTAFFNVASPVFTTASVNQTGDSFARIGSTGSGLTSLAPASTALSTTTWTGTRAGYLDNLSAGAVALHGTAPVWDATSAILDGINDNLSNTNVIRARMPLSGTVSTLDAAGVRSAVGLASANLDTQLTAIDDYLDTEIAAIKAKTDNLPAAPAATGDIPSASAIASQVRTELTTELGRIDAAVSTRLASASYTAPPSVSAIATQVDTTLSGTHGAGSWATATGFSTLTAADIRTAIGLASANLDTQLAALDTLLDSILADTGTDGVALSAAVCNKIADHVLRRTQANAEASSDGDTLAIGSLYGFVQQAQESSVSGSTLTVKKTDGTTTLGTKTLTASAGADPITGIS